MAQWTDDDLLRLDAGFADQGVTLHARPLRAAVAILGGSAVLQVLSRPETVRIVERYAELVPEVSSSWPGLGIGVAASIDHVRKVVVPVPFGSCRIEIWKALGFGSETDWWAWCRQDRDIAAGTAFAAADMHDFAHGLDELGHGGAGADLTLWAMARSNLEDVANTLPASFSVDTVLQPICMVVELALKALLVRDGADPDEFRGRGGHDIRRLADRVASGRPHPDDPNVAAVVGSLPPYVVSRYRPAGLNRLQVVRLALGAQFVLASTLRRVASADLAAAFERDGGWPAPRRPF